MKLIDVYTKLRELKLPSVQTQDVAAYLNISVAHASKILSRLVNSKLMISVMRGAWAFHDIDPFELPSFLCAPFPAYISLQTALYYHGMISQIPDIIYVASLARTHLTKTSLATISIHHIQPSFFFGFEQKENSQIYLATPEKALLDVLYLSPAKSRLFHSLPEIELPKNFKISEAKKMINKITSVRRRTLVERRFFEVMSLTR